MRPSSGGDLAFPHSAAVNPDCAPPPSAPSLVSPQGLAGKEIIMWNAKDEKRMKNVPFFCYSHLLMKVVVNHCPDAQYIDGTCHQPAGVEFSPDPAGIPVATGPLGPFKVRALIHDSHYAEGISRLGWHLEHAAPSLLSLHPLVSLTCVPTSVASLQSVSQSEMALATQMAKEGNCTCTFRFGRRHGHWVINGEDWHSMRIAAEDGES